MAKKNQPVTFKKHYKFWFKGLELMLFKVRFFFFQKKKKKKGKSKIHRNLRVCLVVDILLGLLKYTR